MKNLIILNFFVLLHHSLCQDYTQTRTLLGNGNLVLHYGLHGQKFKFKLVGEANKQIGLGFSYDDSPRDGFLSLMSRVVDLTLSANESGVFKMVKDKKSNVMIESASQTNNVRTIEGYRWLDNCNDEREDIYLRGDILKLFFMAGSNIYDEKKGELEIDMNKRSVYGSEFITLYTRVQTNFTDLEMKFKSFSANLDEIRPIAGGESKCKMFKAPSRAKYFTGFTPNIHGYNGENGLIREMAVYQCSEEAEYDRTTGDCEGRREACSAVLFVWRPGGDGEAFPEGAGVMRGDTRMLLLEVTYNRGTGWLYDKSGLELFYSKDELEKVGKVTVRGEREEGGLFTGLCAGACLARPVTVLSVSLHGGEAEGRLSLASEAGQVLASGYREEFQPTRILPNPVTVSSLELRGSRQCWAVVTFLGELSLIQCGSDSGGQSYCVIESNQRDSLGVLDLLGDLQEGKDCTAVDRETDKISTTVTQESSKSSETASSTESTGEISDISDILRLNSVNIEGQGELSSSPTMKIDIAIIEETSPSNQEELEDIADLEINNISTVITQEDELDSPENTDVTEDILTEDITENPSMSMVSNSTEFEEEGKVNVTRESRFLENPEPTEYLADKDGQINFSKVYRSEASTISCFYYISVISVINFLL